MAFSTPQPVIARWHKQTPLSCRCRTVLSLAPRRSTSTAVLGGALERFRGNKQRVRESSLPAADVPCACESGKEYGRCCRLLHTLARVPNAAEDLLRARYSAYAYRLPSFIMRTTAPAAQEFDRISWRAEITRFCDQYQFMGGIDIIEDNPTGPTSTTIVFRYVPHFTLFCAVTDHA